MNQHPPPPRVAMGYMISVWNLYGTAKKGRAARRSNLTWLTWGCLPWQALQLPCGRWQTKSRLRGQLCFEEAVGRVPLHILQAQTHPQGSCLRSKREVLSIWVMY